MASRLELQSKLEELLGSRNVYYNPPESVKMQYDAIVYSKQNIDARHANNKIYSKKNCYQIIVITRLPDSPIVDSIMELPYCSWERQYVTNNLYHNVLTLYF